MAASFVVGAPPLDVAPVDVVGVSRRDLDGGVLVDAMEAHEGAEDQESRADRLDGRA
ncbi:MAG: hypothetical protein KC636_06665 [Myxococcales bacterium]|nr:hypothetical protein [Myxococcales bacterium]